MEHDSEEFTPIIESGIEYSGVSPYRAPSPRAPAPRTPHGAGSHLPPASPLFSQKKLPVPPRTPTRPGSIGDGKKVMPENGRMSSPRVLMSQSKSLSYNYGMLPEGVSTPSPWRPSSGGIPIAPVKYRNAGVDASTPSPWRSVPRGGDSGAAVKQQQAAMSAEYRLSNGHSRGEDSSPAAMKSAPIRHLSFSRCSFKQVSVDIRRLRQLAVHTPAICNPRN